jgi:long-chain fatty acid transport protein
MRKFFAFFAGTLITGSVLAGGLVTNTNQSAMFTRLQNRNASTVIDAVYFNPAGLTKLADGFYASISNQTIGQTRTITNNYAFLTDKPSEYIGKVSAPIYPGVYAAYKTGKMAFSFGFNPIGGGGGAKYETGLPSFEMGIANVVPLLSGAPNNIPTTAYSADIFFEGSSVYFGYQANASYAINDMISVAAGLRLVSAKNTYNGYINKISINPTYPAFGAIYNGSMVLASDFFTSGATFLGGLSTNMTTSATALQPLVAPYGSTLLSAGAGGNLNAATIAGIQQLLGATGMTPAQIGGTTVAVAQGTLAAAAPVFAGKAAGMTGYAALTGDKTVDVVQTGMGYTPILSVNITPMENLNIALRYEFKTTLELTTKVNGGKDGGGIFVDGKKIVADMPAVIAAGIEYKPMDKLMVTASMNMYFDKNVDYDGSSDVATNVVQIDKNFLEYGLGAEYGISEKLRVSAGWVATSTGVNSAYQSDQRYSTNTNSFGAGFGYRINDMIDLNIGGQYTMYAEGSKDFGAIPLTWKETYNKKTWVIGAGLDFAFGKK